MWRCGNCGFVWEDDEPPDECPKCGLAKEKYAKIEDKAAELIDKSRITNGLHMEIYQLLEEVIDAALDGIDENLDAACVKVFTDVEEMAEVIQQSIKAEIQTHVNKGKWG